MTKDELLGKELCNLYAIAKQVNHYFDGSDISFLSEKMQKMLIEYVKFNCSNERLVSTSLRNLNINPGNTTDSIVKEMTENLHEIATQNEHSDEVKALGYKMSLNRLIAYHVANLENLDFKGPDLP